MTSRLSHAKTSVLRTDIPASSRWLSAGSIPGCVRRGVGNDTQTFQPKHSEFGERGEGPERLDSFGEKFRAEIGVIGRIKQRCVIREGCPGVSLIHHRRRYHPTQTPPAVLSLTREELDLALSKVTAHYHPLFTCLAWTGARPNELFALRWKDVDFKRGEIRINCGARLRPSAYREAGVYLNCWYRSNRFAS